ncbi:hypothetical protein MD484_g561, partial [Candolleomyces efflorescens]
MSTDDKKVAPGSDAVVIESKQLGVWRLLWATNKGRGLNQYIEEFKVYTPYVARLFLDVYAIAPRLFVCFILSRVWAGVENALSMYLSSKILRAIELGISQDPSFVEEILWALGLRVLCSVLIAYLGWLSNDINSQLQARVTSHFDIYLMEVKLRMDIPTSLDAGNKVQASGNDAWDAFNEILNYHQGIIELLSQILVIYREARDIGGSAFVLLCLAKPFYSQIFQTPLWQKVCYAYINNDAYLRVEALKDLASGRFREDILTSNMGSWIIEQYKASREKVGNLSDEHPILQVDKITSATERVVQGVYCGLNVIISPSRFSLAHIAIMQTASTTLRISIVMLFYRNKSLGKNLNTVKEIYSVSSIQNQVDGGKTSYPSSEKSISEGMSFELRNLSFSYPGSHKTTTALDDINLTIPGGAVVVIVGSNGSGKSTLIRILSRLFTPSLGELIIDGSPAQDFDLVELRQASILLSQDNKVYPLSLAENIGLGCLELVDDMDLIKDAAERGGAAGFISKLDTGYGTVLSPQCPMMMLNLHGDPNHPLQKEVEKLPKQTNISGGETQRLIASRSFMRLNSGKIKFVAVDEPSSALDAEGELQLFNRLLEAREGKTMLFVTHRFGHLTKHADMILCMKEGKVVERGTHTELMKESGEYAKLYNIQANAFTQNGETTSQDGTSETSKPSIAV